MSYAFAWQRRPTPASIAKRALGRLPERLERPVRYRLIPDETNLVYQVMRRNAASRVMLDVGACTGGALASFARDGWTVYAFEPDATNRGKLVERWGGTPTVRIDPRAISDRTVSNVPFFRSDVSEGISGLSSFHESHRSAGTVETTTLEVFCRDEQITQVDYLKVDTEGYDLFVLRGFPWLDVSPRVVVCEFEDTKTVPLGYTFDELAGYLRDLDYHVLVSEWYPIVEYGGPHRWRRFANYPCTLADERAWGNLIATKDPDVYMRLIAATKLLTVSWRFGGLVQRLLTSRAKAAKIGPPSRP